MSNKPGNRLPIISRIYIKVIQLLILPITLQSFLSRKIGSQYHVGFFQKIWLLFKIYRNTKKVPSASSWHEHILIVENILNIPKKTLGDIVECGAFKGASASSLSLACVLTGRKLIIFDSFSGLPSPSKQDIKHHCPAVGQIHTYSKGAFKGNLREVKDNIRKYGSLEVCEFIPGFFKNSMPEFISKSTTRIVGGFIDVDLKSSLKTCLLHLWPLLQNGQKLFIHEAHHLEIAELFFDKPWWHKNLHQGPPGLIGAGSGLNLSVLFKTAMGYTIKNPRQYTTHPQDKKI